ncbi:MAG: ATP-binding protein [Verrucomicrobiales bacterium]|nr:ATP-binding protein [Verrucomicrobiales bacterium]
MNVLAKARRAGRGLPGWIAGLLLPLAVGGEIVPVERDFIVHQWRKENGLPDNWVLSVLPARDGFLWVGTRRGVARFDGQHFALWNRSNSSVFVSDRTAALAEDAAGVIWAGTDQGLVRIDGAPERFTFDHLPSSAPYPMGPNSNDIRRVAPTPDGRLMVASAQGLFIRDLADSWKRQAHADESNLEIGPVLGLSVAEDGSLLAGTAGLLRQKRPGGVWDEELGTPVSTDSRMVFALAQAGGESFAIVGEWSQNQGRLFRHGPSGWVPVTDEVIRNFTEPPWLMGDRSGALWHPQDPQLLVRRQGTQETRYHLTRLAATETALCMREDADGDYWVGATGSGLLCLEPRRIQTLTTADGLPHTNTWALLPARDGALWVGTEAGVVRLHDGGTDLFTHAEGLGSDNIRALAEERSGRVWIGTGGGLNHWANGRLQAVEIDSESPWWAKVRSIHVGRDGAVWLGAAAGLHRLHEGQARSWQPADGLPHEDVRAILEDRAGRLWVGTMGGGLAELREDGFRRYTEAEGLSSLNVWAFCEDEEGALWMGTDRGINRLADGRLGAVTTEHGLPDNQVNTLVTDGHGSLWVGHDGGVYRMALTALREVLTGKRDRVHCVAYDEDDGLAHVEVNGIKSSPAAARLPDGRLAFATVAGVALFDPENPPDLTRGPRTHIEGCLATGREILRCVPGIRPPDSLEKGLPPLRIAPSERRLIEITYTATSFRGGGKTRYRYRLTGVNADWVEAGTLQKAVYANLPPGSYLFEVMAANKHGYWSPAPARLAFRLESRFYERAGVQAGGALALLALAYGVVRWRLGELRRIHRLEAEAVRSQERARLAKDLHDGLGANLTELTLLSGIGATEDLPADEVQRRFARLTETTHRALHSLRDLIWTANPKADSVEALAARICQHAERLLDAAGVRCRFDVPIEFPDVQVGPAMRRELLLACSEAFNNIVRHAAAIEVHIRLSFDGAWFQIEIADDGLGLRPLPEPSAGVGPASSAGAPSCNSEDRPLSGPRFTASEPVQKESAALPVATSAANAGDRYLGLASMRERLTALGGRCHWDTSPGAGTTLVFEVALK